MKRKMTAVICTLVMAVSLTATAFAADGGSQAFNGEGSKDIAVYGSYSESAPAVYNVDVKWGSMKFTYNEAVQESVWNPDDHKYVPGELKPAEWSCEEDANKVVVTNHSNAVVKVALSTEINSTYQDSVQAEFKPDDLVLKDAEKDNAGVITLKDASEVALGDTTAAPQVDAFLTLTGTLAETTVSNTVVGSMKITISR